MASEANRFQQDLARAQAELAQRMVESSAGGGAVKVLMSGTQECHKVEIDPGLLEERNAEKLADLVLLAINQAIKDSQLLAARRLNPLGGSMGSDQGTE